MAVNVGELYAELRVDAEQFTQGLAEGRQSLSSLSDEARRAAQEATRSSDTQVQAYGRLRQAAQQAAQAQQRAHDDAAQAAEQVRVAEERLQRVRAQGGNTEQLERRVIEARRDAERATDRAAQALDRMEAANRRAAASARDIDFGRLEREARAAAQAAEQIDVPSGLADRVREIGGAMGDLSGRMSSRAGGDGAAGFVASFSDGIGNLAGKTGPIAGSLLGVAALGLAAGAALAAAIQDGLSAEMERDLFQAQTKTTVAQAEKFARAAGEAYSDVFGESVEENLSTLKLALQNNIIDPGATQRDAEQVIAHLDTIAVALDGEVTTAVNAVSALMSTGLAASAQEASDMIANAVGGSANKGEDLLEIVQEYAAGWKNAGFEANQALALIEQSTDNGAWNADPAADAMREFGRRVSEEGETIVETLNDIGLNGEEMYKKFQEGGDESFDAFDEAFDKIRGLEDPVQRANAVMGLLGDTAGDFSEVFEQWDPSEAVKNFGEFEGAAGRLASTIGGNAATSVEGAMRSITTVADGLKATLAQAFGPYIEDWAASISNNRAGVVQFFLDVGNAAFDGAESLLQFVSSGMRGLAEFAQAGGDMSATFLRSLSDMTTGLAALSNVPFFGNLIPGVGDAADKLDALADAAEKGGDGIASGLLTGADFIDNTLLPGLDNAQSRFNEFGGDMKDSVAFNDALARTAKAISDVGVAADGSTMDLETFTGGLALNEEAPAALAAQMSGLADAFREQTRVGMEAGATVEELTGSYYAQRDALIEQLMATGMSNESVVNYLNTLGLTPDLVATTITQPGMPEATYALDVLKGKVMDVPDEKSIHTFALTDDAREDLEALGLKVETLPDGTVMVTANTADGQNAIDEFHRRNNGRNVEMYVEIQARRRAGGVADDFVGPTIYDAGTAANGGVTGGGFNSGASGGSFADGGITEKYADGTAGKLPDQARIQAPRKRLIQWAEPETEGEAFIPLALSKRARSLEILFETARRMGMAVIDPAALADPTGLGALLGAGDYTGRLGRTFGIDEDDSRVGAVLGLRDLLTKGDYTGNLYDGLGWDEDSPEVDALLGLRDRDPEAIRRGLRNMAQRHARNEYDKVFHGDPHSLDDRSDPFGWRRFLGGDYTGTMGRWAGDEDSPLVDAMFGTRALLANGDYDGSLAKFGIEEDHPAVDALLGLRERITASKFANGGIVEGLSALAAEKAPGLQITDTYRDGAADHHGAGKAVDFSNGSGNTDEMLAWANYLADNYQEHLLELIYDDPRFNKNIKNGQIVDRSFYAGAGDHTNHVHAAMKVDPRTVDPAANPEGAAEDKRSAKQRNVDAVIAEGKKRGASDKEIRAAVATMLAESDGKNLANPNDPETLNYAHDGTGTDHDSAGIFQQRNNGAWGTAEDRMNPSKAAGMFYDALGKVEGRENMTEAQMAQAVQQSAFSDGSNYQVMLEAADSLIADSNRRNNGIPTDSQSTKTSTGIGVGGIVDVRVTNWPTTFTEPKPSEDKPAEEPRRGHGFAAAWYANGGVEDHSAHIAPAGSWRVFAEPETGGEAYIPLSPAKRPRSESILRQVADRFGMQLMADGGFLPNDDPAFKPGGSKHGDTIMSWLGDDAGGDGSLSTLRSADPRDVAAQDAYRTVVGAVGGAMFVADLIQGLLGGGVLGTGIDIAESIQKAIADKAKDAAGGDGKAPLGNPNPAPDANTVGAQFYGPVTITDPEGFIKDQLRQARNSHNV